MKKTILLTGGSGFIGRRFLKIHAQDFEIRSVSLRNTLVEDIDLNGVKSVVYLTGIAHRMDQPEGQIYYDVNAYLAEKLAKQAKLKGVNHFVYISTVKVYGESYSKIPLNEKSDCKPEDDYGKSKLLGEELIQKLQDERFKVAIVRPPMVYGPGVKGNMLRLMKLIEKYPFLPFGNIPNLRSMVYVDNLNTLIQTIILQKAAGVFIAGDKPPISTSELIGYIYKGMEKADRNFSIPFFIRNIIRILKPSVYNRLFGSFVIETKTTNRILKFEPPFSTEFGIREMVSGYKKT